MAQDMISIGVYSMNVCKEYVFFCLGGIVFYKCQSDPAG